MLNIGDRDLFIAEHGPVLYHGTSHSKVPLLLDEGIVPGFDGGGTVATHSFMGSREIAWRHAVKMHADPVLLGVDLARLDPALLEPDPDGLFEDDDVVICNGMLGLDAAGLTTSAEDVVSWVPKDAYFLRARLPAAVTLCAIMRFPSVAHLGTIPAVAVLGLERCTPTELAQF